MGGSSSKSRGEVKLCAQIARYYADNAKQFLAPVPYIKPSLAARGETSSGGVSAGR